MESFDMTTYVTHFADGFTFVSDFTADALAPVLSLTGSTLELSASQATGASVTGTWTILAPLQFKGVFAPESLEVGDWDFQVRLITPGQPPKTILASTLSVLRSV
jgi:hypothetical protein